MAWAGRYLVVGFAGGRVPSASVGHLQRNGYSVVGVNHAEEIVRDPSSMERTFAELARLHAERRIDPLIFEPLLPLEQASDGLTRIARGNTWGKVVVIPDRSSGAVSGRASTHRGARHRR